MAYSLPHTDSEVEALVQRLVNEDRGRQDVLLNLAFQFKDPCAVRDDLRKAYEKCNDISQESRALICTLLKESSEKDGKLHLSMYGKAAQLEKQMETKSAWFQEKYSDRTHGEAQKGMLEEEAMNKKAQEEKIRQEQAENDAFFLEFGVVSMSVLGISYPYLQQCDLILGSCERILSSSLAVTSSGLSSDVSDVGLPSEKAMASGKNGDDGDLLLFRDSPGTSDISAGTLREVGESILLGMECPVAASCSRELSGSMVVTVAAACCKPTVSTVGVAHRAMLGYQRGSSVGHMFTRLGHEPSSMVCSSLPGPNSEQSPTVALPDSLGHALDSCRGHNVKSSTTFYA
ncbi:hypothetical protein Tco_0924856 [Tanacetum coccineum]|uniref:Uncharacterized protein n=1 Tax=Tanacetum coccineum TaxID=301880 RepID=A0ABQ5D644_9ASTR